MSKIKRVIDHPSVVAIDPVAQYREENERLRAKLEIAREALAEIERGGCGTMCDDHPECHHYLSCPWVVATHALARIRE